MSGSGAAGVGHLAQKKPHLTPSLNTAKAGSTVCRKSRSRPAALLGEGDLSFSCAAADNFERAAAAILGIAVQGAPASRCDANGRIPFWLDLTQLVGVRQSQSMMCTTLRVWGSISAVRPSITTY